jgi:hypothetical protein
MESANPRQRMPVKDTSLVSTRAYRKEKPRSARLPGASLDGPILETAANGNHIALDKPPNLQRLASGALTVGSLSSLRLLNGCNRIGLRSSASFANKTFPFTFPLRPLMSTFVGSGKKT